MSSCCLPTLCLESWWFGCSKAVIGKNWYLWESYTLDKPQSLLHSHHWYTIFHQSLTIMVWPWSSIFISSFSICLSFAWMPQPTLSPQYCLHHWEECPIGWKLYARPSPTHYLNKVSLQISFIQIIDCGFVWNLVFLTFSYSFVCWKLSPFAFLA
jgi:hypothetical protein